MQDIAPFTQTQLVEVGRVASRACVNSSEASYAPDEGYYSSYLC